MIYLLLDSQDLGPVPAVWAGGEPGQPVGGHQPPVGEDIPDVGEGQQKGADYNCPAQHTRLAGV